MACRMPQIILHFFRIVLLLRLNPVQILLNIFQPLTRERNFQ